MAIHILVNIFSISLHPFSGHGIVVKGITCNNMKVAIKKVFRNRCKENEVVCKGNVCATSQKPQKCDSNV
jgi:hypothetical protein